MTYIFDEFDVVSHRHRELVTELLNSQNLVREANKARRVRAEALRRRRICQVRSVLFETLPTKVATLLAPACPPCCSTSLAV